MPLTAADRTAIREAELRLLDLALLHYRTESTADDGKPPRLARRTSIWRRTPAGWRIRFHQGTPTDAS